MGTMFRDDNLARRIEAALKPEKRLKQKTKQKGLLSPKPRKRK